MKEVVEVEETLVVDTENVFKENSKEILKEIVMDLEDRDYNAYKQITEYILTGEVGYISSYKECRSRIEKINRRDLVECMLKEFTKWE